LHIDKRGLAFIIYAIWCSLRQANKFLQQPPHVASRSAAKDTRCKRKIQNAARGKPSRPEMEFFAKGGGWAKMELQRGLGQSIDEVLRPPKAMRRIIENSIAVNACAGA